MLNRLLTCYYGPLTLKSLASHTSPYYRNSVITESPAWSDSDDESHYYELPKWLVGRNPKHEVPRDFMKGTTACKEATEAGHSAPAKVIEAGKSAEDLSEEISKEHEIGSSKTSSSCKRDDYSAEDELDAEEMMKRVVGRNPNHEVPSDFMKGTTACKEVTEAGHLEEARLWWLAPAKVIEAGKSEISKEHESLDLDVDSERESAIG